MTLPYLLFKIWEGNTRERFTYDDMNRVEYNANTIAREIAISQVTFMHTTRASQFRYDEAQLLEDLIQELADAVEYPASMEDSWASGRIVSYVDFERWEATLFGVYKLLGGEGERIPADKKIITMAITLYADGWQGDGPYYQYADAPIATSEEEMVVYGSHVQTLEQRVAEYNAMLRVSLYGERLIKAEALSIKPREDLELKLTIGVWDMQEIVTLGKNAWQGTGPWTQTVSLSETPANAVIGTHGGMSADAVKEYAGSVIYVSALGTKSATVTAMLRKPTVDLTPMVAWEEDEII